MKAWEIHADYKQNNKDINSAVLNRGLLQLINLLRKKLLFASTKKVKMRTLGAQRLVVM
jgi:hypothetical protein